MGKNALTLIVARDEPNGLRLTLPHTVDDLWEQR
jgi:hypothetical protein